MVENELSKTPDDAHETRPNPNATIEAEATHSDTDTPEGDAVESDAIASDALESYTPERNAYDSVVISEEHYVPSVAEPDAQRFAGDQPPQQRKRRRVVMSRRAASQGHGSGEAANGEESNTIASAPAAASASAATTAGENEPAASVDARSELSPAEEALRAATMLPVTPAGPFGLLFHAPDLTLLPSLPSRRIDDDFDSDDDRRGGGNRGARTRTGRRRDDDASDTDTEPQRVKGSTRLAAKRQRRREGRDAGRRRTVVTETEFLARREAVSRQMIVRSMHDRVQLAVLEDGVLVEHYVAKSSESSLIGNVYLGRVQNVLPSMEAAFVDIGRGRNAVLYSGEVDWEAAELGGQPRKIELALKPGDTVLVQVTKDPVGHKGARLTSQISLPGRYLVSVPGGSMSGISRKLPDTERARLKKILKRVLPDDMGVIVRTAAEGATEEQLTRDVERLTRQWARIQEQRSPGKAPQRLHAEPDLLVKIVRDVFNEDFQGLVIQGSEAFTTIREYVDAIAPDLLDRVQAYEADGDPFAHYRITEQIDKALERKVFLPSGGSLVIDRTEAMTVVDVNTGRFVGAGGNLEETVTKNNLEAAEEVVRQLRLRDIGGIVVIDFIDMVLESNRDLVQRRLIECLSRDRTKHQVAEVTSLGLVQMTRKKLGLGLLEAYSEPCEECAGRGIIVHHEPVAKSHGSDDRGNGNGRRRGRGGRGGDQQQSQQNGGTHEITEDLRKNLSQIALAGCGKNGDSPTEPSPEEQGLERAETSRAESSDVERAGAEPVSRDAADGAPEVVTILDIPVAASEPREAIRASVQDLDGLLGGALDALQTPPPGTGKAARRSRRASSGIISARPADDGA